MERIIAPSLLAADFANLQTEIEMINDSEADWLHLDVMDGRFVPNISFGFPVINAVNKYCSKHLDVHLMIEEPEKYVEEFVKVGAKSISVHFEACNHLHRNLQQLKALDCMAGVAMNPHTPIEGILDLIEDIDFVCLMSVNPGFGGQKFIERTYDKVKRLAAIRDERNPSMQIQIDGGVTLSNAKALFDAGANNLVAGSTVFNSSNPKNTISELLNV